MDELEFYQERIQALAGAIKKGAEHLLRNPDATLPAAFVTFTSRASQVSRMPVKQRRALHTLPCHQPQPSGRYGIGFLQMCPIYDTMTASLH